MTNWILGHTTRFKAAVTLRSISNFISDDGTRDFAYGHSEDFGGDIFERFETYWDTSPLKYVKNVKTPTLVLHSDMDFRVPIEQGEQWFRALQHFGVPSEQIRKSAFIFTMLSVMPNEIGATGGRDHPRRLIFLG